MTISVCMAVLCVTLITVDDLLKRRHQRPPPKKKEDINTNEIFHCCSEVWSTGVEITPNRIKEQRRKGTKIDSAVSPAGARCHSE